MLHSLRRHVIVLDPLTWTTITDIASDKTISPANRGQLLILLYGRPYSCRSILLLGKGQDFQGNEAHEPHRLPRQAFARRCETSLSHEPSPWRYETNFFLHHPQSICVFASSIHILAHLFARRVQTVQFRGLGS